jgi:lysophospholipase L1-like esterase
MFPNVRKLADEARDAGSVPVLYQTWGRQHGNPRLSSKHDFMAMNRRVREGYRDAARDAGGLLIVPAGDVWEREVAAGRGNLLYKPDGSHPTPYAERLIAETFYKTLFPETSSSHP